MNTLEEQALQFKITTEEYIRRKNELDQWYLEQLYGSVKDKPLTLKDKIRVLCEEFRLDYEEVLASYRGRYMLMHRQAFIYALRTYGGYSAVELGREFRKDHSTIIHTTDVVKGWIAVQRSREEELRILDRVREIVVSLKTPHVTP
jgi:chromosomal replication initiator protein